MNGSWGKVMVESLRILCLTSTELSLNKYIVFQLTRQVKNQVIFKVDANRASEVCGHRDYNPGLSFHFMTLYHCKQIGRHSCSFQSLNRMWLLLLLEFFFPLLIYVDALQVAQCCGISKHKHVLGINITGYRQTWDLGMLPGLYL